VGLVLVGARTFDAQSAPAEPAAAEPVAAASAPPVATAPVASAVTTDNTDPFGDDRPAHTLRTTATLGVMLGGFSAGYWLTRRTKVEGWDFFDFGERLDKEAWKFDNNSLVVNFLLHPLSGAATYAIARANHHGILVSAGFSMASSYLWESVFEYRSKVSLNDMIVTAPGGLALGEFLHQLGLYLDTAAQPGMGMGALQWSLSPFVQFDRVLDGRDHGAAPVRDALGLTSAIWHDFSFAGAVGASNEAGRLADGDRTYTRFDGSVRARLATMPGYLRPGRFERWFYDFGVTAFDVGFEDSKHGVGLLAVSDGLLAGYHFQDISGLSGTRRGVAVTTGASLGFDYLDSRASSFREQLGVFHLPGPALDWHVQSGELRCSLRARAHPDFGGVSGMTYDEWSLMHPGERGKYILRNMGYYYAWGGSGSLGLDLEAGPFRAQGDVYYGRYRSEEGLGRWQERVTLDAPAGTQVVMLRASLDVRPPGSPIAVGAQSSARYWESWVGEAFGRAQVLTHVLRLSASF
jgi:hypothetical protein